MLKLYQVVDANGGHPAIEYLPSKNNVPLAVPVIASGTGDNLSYIYDKDGKYLTLSDKPADENGLYAMIALSKDAIYSAPLNDAGASNEIGANAEINSDGEIVTAGVTNGAYEVVGFATDDRDAGDTAYVKYIK